MKTSNIGNADSIEIQNPLSGRHQPDLLTNHIQNTLHSSNTTDMRLDNSDDDNEIDNQPNEISYQNIESSEHQTNEERITFSDIVTISHLLDGTGFYNQRSDRGRNSVREENTVAVNNQTLISTTSLINDSTVYDLEMQAAFSDYPEESKSIELTTFNTLHGVEKLSDNQNSTTSNSSVDDPLSVTISSEMNQTTQHQTSIRQSTTNRFVNNHELRFMVNLPEKTETNRLKLKSTSFLTPHGLFQLNREYHEFRQILSLDIIRYIAPKLAEEDKIIARDGQLAYDVLSRQELERLEQTVRDYHGHSLIGYSLNEEVFLRALGEYPPLPDAFSKRVFNTLNSSIVRDTTLSLRTAALSLMLFIRLVYASMQFNAQEQENFNTFYYNHIPLFLSLIASVAAAQMIFLRSELVRQQTRSLFCIETFGKQEVLTGINRFRLIQESMIGVDVNWTTYGTLISSLILSQKITDDLIGYGLIPVLLYGLRKGYLNEDIRYTAPAINIAQHTQLKTAWHGLEYALTTGSFFALGAKYFTIDIVYATITDDARAYMQSNNSYSYTQYAACGLALMAHLARYPNAPTPIKRWGRYAANISNSIGNSMLDNFAMYAVISLVLQLIFVNGISESQTNLLIFLYILQSTTLRAMIEFCV